jgi:hypothetical protein
MVDHVLRFRGAGTAEDPVHYGPLLRLVLNALVDGCQQATRFCVEGRSTAKGTAPAWLERAAAFHIEQRSRGELILQGAPLGNEIPNRLWPPPLFAAGNYEPARSSLDLLEDSLEHAIGGGTDSDLYDRSLLETFESFGRLFEYGVEAIELINGRTVRLDPHALSRIQERRTHLPEDRKVSITGVLLTSWNSDRSFALGLETGAVVRGILNPTEARAANVAALHGKLVDVSGLARFHRSGAVFRIEAERLVQVGATPEPVDVKAQIRHLVEDGRVREARLRVQEEEEAGRGSAVGAWAKVLALPTAEARAAGKREDMTLNRAWLTRHQAEHVDAWVALHDGELVDSDRSLLALQKRLRANKHEQVFLTKCGGVGGTKTGS